MLLLGWCFHPDSGSSHEALLINIHFQGEEGCLTFRKQQKLVKAFVYVAKLHVGGSVSMETNYWKTIYVLFTFD